MNRSGERGKEWQNNKIVRISNRQEDADDKECRWQQQQQGRSGRKEDGNIEKIENRSMRTKGADTKRIGS